MILNFSSDPYNLLHKRNVRNTERCRYNCVGYAFETFSGFNLGRTWSANADIMNYANDGDYDNALKLATKEILAELPEWSLARDYDKEKYPAKKFKVVAIRFADCDYHAYKLGKNSKWYNKWGKTDIIKCLPYEAVFKTYWETCGICYDSPIVFFVSPRR